MVCVVYVVSDKSISAAFESDNGLPPELPPDLPRVSIRCRLAAGVVAADALVGLGLVAVLDGQVGERRVCPLPPQLEHTHDAPGLASVGRVFDARGGRGARCAT